MARPPYIGSGRAIEGGALATRKQDFNAHVDGSHFRQMADTVDIAAIEGVAAANVQEALESLNGLITSAGSGFISIGLADGYAQGSYTVGAEGYDNLRDAFNGAVADPRLENGGVILILAGTYRTSATITVPAGITVLGEASGTIIVGEMADTPMFQITGTSNKITIGGDDGGGDLPLDSGGKHESVKFSNLMLIDNLDGYAAFGAPSMTTVPMIRLSIDANLTCEHVRFIGRVAQGSPPRTTTYAALGVSSGSSSGTHLSLYKCFFDGIKVPIQFNPGGGELDFLRVENCRARVFGMDDDAAAGYNEENCFINMTQCNANISSNYVYPGPHTYLECMVNIFELYDDNSKIILINNSGTGAVGDNYGRLLNISDEINDSNIPTFQKGNIWSVTLGEWYVIAGVDYIGENAIDILGIVSSNSTIIYVVQGTYTVTNSGSSFLRLVGINQTPTVNLNVSSGTDTFLSNRVFNCRSVENINFVAVSNYHTILCNSSQPATFAKSCSFTNCAFVVNESLSSTTLSNVTVRDCKFVQDATFGENLSLLLPAAKTTVVENCYFDCNGYIGGIGDSSTYNSAVTDAVILIKNCIMTADDHVFNALSPLVGTADHFFWINESTSVVSIENCKILNNNTYKPNDSSIDSSITSAGDFNKFIYIKARDITIKDCIINGPDAVTTIGGIISLLPGLYLEPQANVTVTDTKFNGSAFSLQIGGTTAFTALSDSSGTTAERTRNNGITIRNCDFSTYATYGFTCLDVDVDLATIPNLVKPRVTIDGCTFTNSNGDEVFSTHHYAVTGSTYTHQAIVQIYANLFDVFFNNNVVRGFLTSSPAGDNPQLEFAGVMINNTDNDTLSGEVITTAHVSHNTIYMETTLARAVGMDSIGVVSLSVKSSIIDISNNYIALHFSGAETDDSYLECLKVHCDDSPGYGDGMVSNNMFSYRDQTGTVGMLKDYFVNIHNSSARGAFVNNSFSDKEVYTSSGTSTTDLINNAADWYVAGNRNYEQTITVNPAMGRISMINTSSGIVSLTGGQLLFGRETVMSSIVYAFSDTVTVLNIDNNEALEFDWIIPMAGYIPEGAKIISATITREISNTTPSTKTIQITAMSTTGGSDPSSSTNMTTTSVLPKTWTAGADHYNIPGENVTLTVSVNLLSTADVSVNLTDFEITYVI